MDVGIRLCDVTAWQRLVAVKKRLERDVIRNSPADEINFMLMFLLVHAQN